MKTLRKIISYLSLACLVWLVLVSISIWQYGKLDQAQPADVIIVLGAAIYHDQPSPVFAERIRHGVQLYQQGFANKLLFTGGYGSSEIYAESLVAAHFANSLDIPHAAMLTETNSHTTQQNLFEAKIIMQQYGFKTALLVSDPLHLKRASQMASDLRIQVYTSPTPTSRYRSWQTQSKFLFRELYFLHHYWLVGE